MFKFILASTSMDIKGIRYDSLLVTLKHNQPLQETNQLDLEECGVFFCCLIGTHQILIAMILDIYSCWGVKSSTHVSELVKELTIAISAFLLLSCQYDKQRKRWEQVASKYSLH